MILFGAYLFIPLVLLLAAAAVRQRALRPAVAVSRVDPRWIPAEELALLAGGPARAADVCLVSLFEAGSIDRGTGPATVAVKRPLPPGAHPLARTVYRMIEKAGELNPALVRAGLPGHRLDAGPTQARLADAGLAPKPDAVRTLGRLRLALAAAVLAGLVLLPVAVLADGAGVLALAPALVVLGALMVPATRVPAATKAGMSVISLARSEAVGLEAGGVPGQRAHAVALFGPSALSRSDPAMARLLGLSGRRVPRNTPRPAPRPARRPQRRSGYGRSASDSGGFSWWGGDGGSSWGSGDGGSSCGGGGGCGGGGS